MSVATVFVAGSRHISRLPAEVKLRVDAMVEKGLRIFVGDANGADKAFQSYLAQKSYGNVVVHCMSNRCRNNIGNWPTHQLPAPVGARGFDFYSVKDRAMSDFADYGLMLWDGKSKGTISNVVNLTRRKKPVAVYIASVKTFETVKTFEDLSRLLSKGDPASVERLTDDLHLNLPSHRAVG